MKLRWLLLPLLVLVVTLVVGCSKSSSGPTGGDSAVKETSTVDPKAAPFVFNKKDIAKATISRGDGQLAVTLTDTEKLDRLSGILDGAPSFFEAYPFDLLGIIMLESKNGTQRELRVTGNGYVFVDETAKVAYQLDKQKFFDFVGELTVG